MMDDMFKTFTMAKLYTSQKKYTEATAIYKYLLKDDPHNKEYINALEYVEKKRFKIMTTPLSTRFNQWIDLLIHQSSIERYKKIQSTLEQKTKKNEVNT